MTPQNRELLERGVGIIATFVLFRTVSRLTTGIAFPGTAAAVVATAGAAMCSAGQGGPVCTAQSVVNWPGRQVGRLVVGGAGTIQQRLGARDA